VCERGKERKRERERERERERGREGERERERERPFHMWLNQTSHWQHPESMRRWKEDERKPINHDLCVSRRKWSQRQWANPSLSPSLPSLSLTFSQSMREIERLLEREYKEEGKGG
jgi:hypothetical protein